jgi:transcriptional regulator GlxA family with amidase domain
MTPGVVGGWLALIIAYALEPFVAQDRQPPDDKPFSRRCRQALEIACSFIEININRPMTLDEIARQVGLSARHLSRVFKLEMSITLHDYILDRRLRRAMEAMKSGPDLQIKAIANDCGFSSPSHFSMAFRKHVGVPPLDYYSRLR